jgi:two-component system CheB/CheR fusion protein
MDVRNGQPLGTKAPANDEARPRGRPLPEVSERLSEACSVADVMAIIARTARILVGCDGVTLVLRDGDLCHYAEEDAISPLWKGSRFPMSACISGWCMLEGQVAAIPDIYLDPRIPHDAYRPTFVKSLVMVPIGAPDAVAAMGAYWADRYEATASEIALIRTIADTAEASIRKLDGQAPDEERSGPASGT